MASEETAEQSDGPVEKWQALDRCMTARF